MTTKLKINALATGAQVSGPESDEETAKPHKKKKLSKYEELVDELKSKHGNTQQ